MKIGPSTDLCGILLNVVLFFTSKAKSQLLQNLNSIPMKRVAAMLKKIWLKSLLMIYSPSSLQS